MHFIHPIFLLGLAVAAIPLLIHLLRHRRVRTVRFSSIEFLKLLHKKHSLRIRISQSLLLLARILLAIVVTLLFAQPFFTWPALSFLNTGPRQVIAFLDNSGSMQLAGPGGKTLYQESTEQLSRLVSSLSPREALTVITLAPRARAVFRGKPEDFAAASLPQAMAGTADVDGAVRLAQAAELERPGSERQLAVFSDFGRFPLERLSVLTGEVVLFPGRIAGASNRAIGAIAADSDRVVVGETVTLRVPVHRFGAPRETQLSLSVGGKVVDRRHVPAGAGPAQVVFTTRVDRPGTFPLAVSCEPDSLPGDDRSYSVVDAIEQRRVAIVTGRALPPAEGARDRLFFLRRALQGAAITVSEAPEKLEGASLIVLLRPDLLSETQSRELAAQLRAGANVVTFLGPDEVDAAAASRIWLDEIGSLRATRKVEGTAPWRATGASGAIVEGRYWEGVASSARFLIEPGKTMRRERVLAQFDDGTPAVYSAVAGRGLYTLVNASAGLEGSDLPLHPIFPIFLTRLLSWTPERLSVHLAGDEVSFTLPMEEFGAQLQVTAPGDRVTTLQPERRGRQLVATFGGTDVPGLYKFERVLRGRRVTQHFVVQWPQEESALDFPADADLLGKLPGARVAGGEGASRWSGRLPLGLQDILLSVVILLMLLETWLVFDLERQMSRDAARESND